MESWLRQHLHGESLQGYVGVPHRLDRGVSGVLLFAATPRAARQLSRQFERRQIRKSYLAIVAGGEAARDAVEAMVRAAAEAGSSGDPSAHGSVVWRDTIAKIADQARASIVPDGESGGREAVTLARLCGRLAGDRLLVELSPVTGRMHQLRLQAAARGLPVLGDDLYGAADATWMTAVPQGADSWREGEDRRTSPIALHARRISYADPDTKVETTVEAALPDYWPEPGPEPGPESAG